MASEPELSEGDVSDHNDPDFEFPDDDVVDEFDELDEIEEIDEDVVFVTEVTHQPPKKSDPATGLVIRDNGPNDDNDQATFEKRIHDYKLTQRDVHAEMTITLNVKGENYEGSAKPWKVDTATWKKLYPFQRDGVRWMQKRTDQRCGGILADEMGLGKTVQAIVFLRSIADTKRTHMKTTGLDKCLVVCPMSVLDQWITAFNTWFPTLRVFLLHGHCSTRNIPNYVEKMMKELRNSKHPFVLLTTYETFTKNKDIGITDLIWQVVLLDEGHHIRNDKTKCSDAMKKLRCPHRFILSGTPFQNNLQEFWKLVDFVDPGRFSTWKHFYENFVKVIDAGSNLNCSILAAAKAYECLVVVQRASKDAIIQRLQRDHKDVLLLKEKHEVTIRCDISDRQREIYEKFLGSSRVEAITNQTADFLAGIRKLQDICNHPGIYDQLTPTSPGYGTIRDSGKVKKTFKLLDRWFAEDPATKIILFTSRKKVVVMFEHFLKEKSIPCVSFTGDNGAHSRAVVIRKFNEDPSVKVFIITTRAGGQGLNLTVANKVIIFDPDWNPNVDKQAADRIYRPGQTKHVQVVRLLSAGTVEEVIYRKAMQKQERGDQVMKEVEGEDHRGSIPNNLLADYYQLKPPGYRDPVFEQEEASQGGLGRDKKSSKKKKKNKLAGFEDRAALSLFLDNDKVTTMRNHSIAVQNSSEMTRKQKKELRDTVDKAVSSVVHNSGRLSAEWQVQLDKRLGLTNGVVLRREYNTKKEEKDDYWRAVHNNGITSKFSENNDQKELDHYVDIALKWAELLAGSGNGVKESLLMSIPGLGKKDREDSLRVWFLNDILSKIATYDPETQLWKCLPKYRNLNYDIPSKNGSRIPREKTYRLDDVNLNRRKRPSDESIHSTIKKSSSFDKPEGSSSSAKRERTSSPTEVASLKGPERAHSSSIIF